MIFSLALLLWASSTWSLYSVFCVACQWYHIARIIIKFSTSYILITFFQICISSEFKKVNTIKKWEIQKGKTALRKNFFRLHVVFIEKNVFLLDYIVREPGGDCGDGRVHLHLLLHQPLHTGPDTDVPPGSQESHPDQTTLSESLAHNSKIIKEP